jgi:hypothetical protein
MGSDRQTGAQTPVEDVGVNLFGFKGRPDVGDWV